MPEAAPLNPVVSLAADIDRLWNNRPSWTHFRPAFQGQFALPETDESSPFEAKGVSPEADAALWAFSYVPHMATVEQRTRLELRPGWEASRGEIWPPAPSDVSDEVATLWDELGSSVTTAVPRSYLRLASFIRGGPRRQAHGKDALDSLRRAALETERDNDRVKFLQRAHRVARMLRDNDEAERSVTELLNFVEDKLRRPEKGIGTGIIALEGLSGEPGLPARFVDLIEESISAAHDARMADKLYELLLKQLDRSDHAEIWRRRVDHHRRDANASSQTAIKAHKLQVALEVAQKSGQKQLRQEVAAEMQALNAEEFGFEETFVRSFLFEEAIERETEAMSAGENWQQSLVTFAQQPPLSGESDANRDSVGRTQAQHPLLGLFPTQLYGPDGLPTYTGTTPEDRFDVEMVQLETQYVKGWIPILTSALSSIPVRHGLPDHQEVAKFLTQWPGFAPEVAQWVSMSLLRYWAGDAEGATYTVLPKIELVVRTLVMQQGVGVYRPQQEHTPGQSPGLGALLPLLQEAYELPESEIRYLDACLTHPVGLNLRNLMLHGYGHHGGPGAAALVLQIILRLGLIRNEPARSQET